MKFMLTAVAVMVFGACAGSTGVVREDHAAPTPAEIELAHVRAAARNDATGYHGSDAKIAAMFRAITERDPDALEAVGLDGAAGIARECAGIPNIGASGDLENAYTSRVAAWGGPLALQVAVHTTCFHDGWIAMASETDTFGAYRFERDPDAGKTSTDLMFGSGNTYYMFPLDADSDDRVFGPRDYLRNEIAAVMQLIALTDNVTVVVTEQGADDFEIRITANARYLVAFHDQDRAMGELAVLADEYGGSPDHVATAWEIARFMNDLLKMVVVATQKLTHQRALALYARRGITKARAEEWYVRVHDAASRWGTVHVRGGGSPPT